MFYNRSNFVNIIFQEEKTIIFVQFVKYHEDIFNQNVQYDFCVVKVDNVFYTI